MATKSCPNYDCHYGSFCDNFCPKCGRKLVKGCLHPATNFPCPECKASVFLSDEFCGACGKKIVFPYFVFVFQTKDKNWNQIGDGGLAVANGLEKAWEAFASRRKLEVEAAKRYYRLTGIFLIPKMVRLYVFRDNQSFFGYAVGPAASLKDAEKALQESSGVVANFKSRFALLKTLEISKEESK